MLLTSLHLNDPGERTNLDLLLSSFSNQDLAAACRRHGTPVRCRRSHAADPARAWLILATAGLTLRLVLWSGVHLLYNETVELPAFHLMGRAGITDMKEGRVPLDRLMQGGGPQKPTVVLYHDLKDIRKADASGMDLVLRGIPAGPVFPMDLLPRWVRETRAFADTASLAGAIPTSLQTPAFPAVHLPWNGQRVGRDQLRSVIVPGPNGPCK